MSDYMTLLGIEPNDTDDIVRKKYRQLVAPLHPDRNTSPQAEEQLKVINSAYAEWKKNKNAPATPTSPTKEEVIKQWQAYMNSLDAAVQRLEPFKATIKKRHLHQAKQKGRFILAYTHLMLPEMIESEKEHLKALEDIHKTFSKTNKDPLHSLENLLQDLVSGQTTLDQVRNETRILERITKSIDDYIDKIHADIQQDLTKKSTASKLTIK